MSSPLVLRQELRRRTLPVGRAAELLLLELARPRSDARAQAISLALELEQLDPEEPHVRALADLVHFGDGRDEPPSSPRAPISWVTLGDDLLDARVSLATGRAAEAERTLVAILAFDRDNPVAQMMLFRAEQRQSKLRDAMRVWESLSAAKGPSALTELRALYERASQQREPAPPPRATAGLPDAWHGPLEAAFRTAASGKLEEAAALCERLRTQARAASAQAYKLVTIAYAWIVEVGGKPAEARRVLEELVDRPELADDSDCLSSLVRLLEQDPDALHRAAHVYERLHECTGDPAMLGRLGRLYARLGDAERARAAFERQAGAFEQGLGALRLMQLLRVAARRNVPVEDLRRLEFSPAEKEFACRGAPGRTETGARKVALLALLVGDSDGAYARFRELAATERATALDLAYLGELALLDNRPEAASTWYRESLDRRSSTDGADAAWLLKGMLLATQRSARAKSGLSSGVGAEFSDPARLHGELAALARARPADPGVWRALAGASRLIGREDEGLRHEERAEFLERHAPHADPPGHALAVAAYHARGERKGMVHELWVSRYRARPYGAGQLAERDIFANVTDDFRQYTRGVFESVKAYAKLRFAHLTGDIESYAYQFKLTNEDERSSGPSAGLAIAVAFVSLFLERPVPEGTALSGVLVTEARDRLALRRVGDADVKVEGALARGVRRFVLPSDSRPDVEQSDLVPARSAGRIVVYAANLDEALECVFGPGVFLW